MGAAGVCPCKARSLNDSEITVDRDRALGRHPPSCGGDYLPLCLCLEGKANLVDLEGAGAVEGVTPPPGAPAVVHERRASGSNSAPLEHTERSASRVLTETASEAINRLRRGVAEVAASPSWSRAPTHESLSNAGPDDARASDIASRAKSRDPEAVEDGSAGFSTVVEGQEIPADLEESPPQSSRSGRSAGSRWQAIIMSVKWAGIDRWVQPAAPANMVKMKPSSNGNRPQDYAWLEDVLHKLSQNEAAALNCHDSDNGDKFTPIFFLIGACPNILCGMQAVMYCAGRSCGKVCFWWVKPAKGTGPGPPRLEEATLQLHTRGSHKNDPGRSRQFLKPLADVFESGASTQGWRFGTEVTMSRFGKKAVRAFLQQEREDAPKMWVHILWQEDWSNPLSSKKYIKGKIVYQKFVAASQYFSRQYEYNDGVMTISAYEEPPHCAPLPTDEVKTLWDLRAMGKP